MRKLFISFILLLMAYATAFGATRAEVLAIQDCESVQIYIASIDSGVPELEVYAFGLMHKQEPEQPTHFIFVDTTTNKRWAIELIGEQTVRYTVEDFFKKYPTACKMFEKTKV